jgi:hypothetical protein
MNNTFVPGPTPNTVRAADGRVLTAPEGWILLPPGDAALTRRVKEAGDHWVVQEKKGRKTFSRGVWAPAATIDRIRAELKAERSTEGYARRKEADARRREKGQAEYVEDFFGAVVAFLAFHLTHAELADRLARAVTDHATPVGSGTVARTRRIPVAQRAEAAVIAWMRHQATGYDDMVIPKVKGKRRVDFPTIGGYPVKGVYAPWEVQQWRKCDAPTHRSSRRRLSSSSPSRATPSPRPHAPSASARTSFATGSKPSKSRANRPSLAAASSPLRGGEPSPPR